MKRGLRTRIEMGLIPGPPPTGYVKDKHIDRKCHSLIDPLRGPVIKEVFEKVAHNGWSGRKIYHWLKDEMKLRSTSGNKPLTLSNIYILLRNPFYYGMIEYPKGSGKMFIGKHEPLVSKDLFDMVQEKVKGQVIKSQGKEFAFTRMMTCGLCGSGICADEKFKQLKDGTVNRHVYYGCTRSKDRDCKCGWINENDLIKQFELLMDTIDLDEVGIKEKVKAEVEKYKRFQQSVLNLEKPQKIVVKDIDIRNYAKYILREGEDAEKRELLGCLRSKIILKEKNINLKYL